MKRFNLPIIFSVLFIIGFLISCGSALKSYQKGDYFSACEKSVKKLQSKPNDIEALQVLQQSYSLLQNDYLQEIDLLDANLSIANNDKVIKLYEKLNKVAGLISHCPAAMQVVPNPKRYDDVLQDRKNTTAEYFYKEGMHALHIGTVEEARAALDDFKKVGKYVPGYKDTDEKIREAQDAATLQVLVMAPMFPSRYRFDANNLFHQLINNINQGYHRYPVAFHTEYEAMKRPHQRMVLDFQDFVLGNTNNTSNSEKLERSVIVGYEDIPGGKEPIYETVKGHITIYRIEVIAYGLLDVRITDYETNRYINQKTIRKNSVWISEWATFTGDRRVLNAHQLELIGRRQEAAPSREVLFRDVVRQLYNDAALYINSLY